MATPLAPLRGLLSQLSFTNFPLKRYDVPPGAASSAAQQWTLYCHGPGFNDDATSFDPQSLKWIAYLTFAKITFRIEYCNEPLMSPNGHLPYLALGRKQCVAADDIFALLTEEAVALPTVSTEVAPRMTALIALVENTVGDAVTHYLWCEPDNYQALTSAAYTGHYSWPVNRIQACTLRREHTRALTLQPMTGPELYRAALEALRALSDHLGDADKYFFDAEAPTLLDAVVLAYLFPVLSAPMPQAHFRAQIKEIPRLESYVRRLWATWFDPSRSLGA
ncbi:hypothetical protein H4R35_003668 [Dimargaris xerosporica]|nr:hypothetical protein H4R35_003668 [Dimargaris xerosporica]